MALADARVKTDEAYKDLIKRIEAMMLLNGENPIYAEFIKKLNVVIEKYKNIIAQREGIAKAKKS
jgi:hypothetical protein